MIHSSAVVHPTAKIAEGCVIGAFSFVGEGVELKERVVVAEHAVIYGPTRLGAGSKIGAHSVVGGAPQSALHDVNVQTELFIGEEVTIREHCTVHRGSSTGSGVTRIGNNTLIMVGSHVAHDCVIGSSVVVSNGCQLAGHVQVFDGAVIGGMVAVHQFARVGRLAMIAGGSMVSKDVPPFSLVAGDRATVRGVNRVGLRRAGMSEEETSVVRRVFRRWLADGVVCGEHPLAEEFRRFVQQSSRGVSRGRSC